MAVLAVALTILHWKGASKIMIIGLIVNLFFIIDAIYEINTSKRIDRNEKNMWTVGLICITAIVGFIYIFSGRKRIVEK